MSAADNSHDQEPEMEIPVTEGWAMPLASRRFHYFRGPISLCRNWMYSGVLEEDFGPSPLECRACRAALQKERERVTNAKGGTDVISSH